MTTEEKALATRTLRVVLTWDKVLEESCPRWWCLYFMMRRN